MRLIFWCFSSTAEFPESDYSKLKGYWISLVHLLSYLISSFWFSYIAEYTWKVYGKQVTNPSISFKSVLRQRSQEIFRLFLFGIVLLQIKCVSWFPYIGTFLKFLAWCLIS